MLAFDFCTGVIAEIKFLRVKQFIIVALALLFINASVYSDVVERYNAAGDLTASGSDISIVQKESGAANGDVIIVSGTATHTTTVPYQSSGGYPAETFTIRSATDGVQQTVNAGTSRFYNFNNGVHTYNFTLKDLAYQGNDAVITSCIGVFLHSSAALTMNLNLDNVSFTGFKETQYTGAVIGFDYGYLNINASNGVVFDGNQALGTGSAEYRGAAINVSQQGALTINVADGDVITFKNNYAKTCGSAINVGQKSTPLSATINGDSLFESNSSGSWGGAVHVWGNLTFNGDTTFTNNKGSGSDGGAIRQEGAATYTTKFNGDVTMTGNSAPAASGGAICSNGIVMNSDNINFTNNSAKTFGGAIRVTTGNLSMTGKSIVFDSNYVTANDGGALQINGDLTITGSDSDAVTTFNKNHSMYVGGAISAHAVTLTNGTFNFTGNYDTGSSSSYSYGGALYCTSISTDASVLNFDSNSSKYYGGAVEINGGGGTIKADSIIFNENTATYFGGAVHARSGTLNITGKSISFSDNKVTAANADGGAIRTVNGTVLNISGVNDESKTVFSGNSSTRYGGALSCGALTLTNGSFEFNNNVIKNYVSGATGGGIYCSSVNITGSDILFTNNVSSRLGGGIGVTQSVTIQGETILFSGNKAYFDGYSDGLGGAIYAANNVTFSGNNAVGTFTDNVASQAGNDIYIANQGTLTFQDSGSYTFDGGVYLANENSQTTINQAQVTFSGRENDSTNIYELQNVSISNGGKLTANLDNINSISGNFTIDNSSTLEFNTSAETSRFDNAIDGSGILLKTGTGTLALNGSDDNPITASSFNVQNGSLLFKGEYTGALTIQDGALFSPGNSVGTLTMAGDFTAQSGSTLLFEQDATGIDQLILTSGTLDVSDDAILEISLAAPSPLATYMLIQVDDGLSGQYATDEFWNGILSPASGYYWNLSVIGNQVFAQIDANAAPEPSTWALLALGVAGLAYLRRRVSS